MRKSEISKRKRLLERAKQLGSEALLVAARDHLDRAEDTLDKFMSPELHREVKRRRWLEHALKKGHKPNCTCIGCQHFLHGKPMPTWRKRKKGADPKRIHQWLRLTSAEAERIRRIADLKSISYTQFVHSAVMLLTEFEELRLNRAAWEISQQRQGEEFLARWDYRTRREWESMTEEERYMRFFQRRSL